MDETSFSIEKFFDLSSFEHRAVFAGCSYVWQVLERLEAYLLRQKLGKIHPSHQEYSYLVNPDMISIGEGTVVEPGAYIRGPCIIGRDCQIRQGAYIRGNVMIGDRCIVGHTTELKHAILLNHARAAHFAFVGDSVLGNDVNLGAGVKCANLRLDGSNVFIRYHQQSISTGLRKFGAIVGDGCQIGCNVVMNPGTLFGKHAKCYPCTNIGGVIEEGMLVKHTCQVSVIEDL
jgi:UDP-N-acetylglucosamine diphosphorylase / glucose-1-phosphate thymidylyltransferase / UDP-N-acetylgalactosamine diphosphorylase / glucosamine-1-phosphate N-acetyltransferase / galactosamine-1-phosphate N-acetyltransferase